MTDYSLETFTSADLLTGKPSRSIRTLTTITSLTEIFLGIPKEPIGFGNNYKPFGNPKYEPAVVTYTRSLGLQEIKLFEVF